MAAIASLLLTLSLSLLVTRVAAMAFMLTGMSRESARFQARSAFTGVGYTTTESEDVVRHPVRRRILMLLMLLGNLGVATVVATVMLSFMQAAGSERWWLYIGTAAAGLTLLWIAATNRFVERQLNRLISWTLRNWGALQVRDYAAILRLEGGYAISELLVEANDWLAENTLSELKLPHEGVLVLAIRRVDGTYLATPTGDMKILAHDVLILYAQVDRVEELDQRRRGRGGDRAHQTAVVEHEIVMEEQVETDVQIEQAVKKD